MNEFQDYMDDSHGKEISLQYVTVKVPGQKPRGSRGTQSIAATPQFALGGVATTTSTTSTTAATTTLLLANGVSDPLNPASMAGSGFPPANKDKRTGKVMLTGYEVLKDPVDRSDDVIGVSLTANGASGANGGDAGKSETPSVKKRHRRMKSSSNKANDLEGKFKFKFKFNSMNSNVK